MCVNILVENEDSFVSSFTLCMLLVSFSYFIIPFRVSILFLTGVGKVNILCSWSLKGKALSILLLNINTHSCQFPLKFYSCRLRVLLWKGVSFCQVPFCICYDVYVVSVFYSDHMEKCSNWFSNVQQTLLVLDKCHLLWEMHAYIPLCICMCIIPALFLYT